MLITINTLPVITGNFVFADSVPSGFTQVDNEADQVEAFKYYCKSRNLAIEGSVLDAVTQVTTKAYQTAVNAVSSEIGFDINSLQNELYKRNTSSGQEFFYTASGINAMNRIFAEFLQNNNLAVGDEVNDQVLEQGKFYNGSFVYVFQYTDTLSVSDGVSHQICLSTGTPFMSTEAFTSLYNSTNRTASVTTSDGTFIFPMYYVSGGYYAGNGTSYAQYTNLGTRFFRPGFPAYFYTTKGQLAFGAIFGVQGSSTPVDNRLGFMCRGIITGQNDNIQDTTVYITTNNTTINNNNYEGDTIIKNNGQTEKPNPPIPDPNDDHNSTTDPINPSDPDSDSNLTFPLLDLDLPSIDWSIGDLSNKFPFSIPFDLYNMFSVLNTEPQTPEIKGNIDLGIYEWSLDWNLHQFDDTAELLRNVEFVGFIIGLIFITRSLIKG